MAVESTAVDWLTPAEVAERMSEVSAIRLRDALAGNGPPVRSHDGKQIHGVDEGSDFAHGGPWRLRVAAPHLASRRA